MPRLHVNSTTIDYCEAGTGMPVVFIPGISEFKESFAFQFRGLSDSYRLISYDVRRGLKRASDYTLDLLVNDLKKLLEGLKLDSAVICGHSFGGLIAMRFALDNPAGTKALILVSPFASPPTNSPARLQRWISSIEHPYNASLGTRLKVRINKLFASKVPSSQVMDDQVAVVRSIAKQAKKTSPTTITQRMRIIMETDLRESLEGIQAPTLLVAGAKDKAFFLSSAQEIYERIPNATLEVIENGAHFCFATRHDRFNAAVDEFLTKHLARIS